MLEVFEGIETNLVPARAFAHAVMQGDVQSQLGIGKRRNKYRHTFFICRLQNPALLFRPLRQKSADGVIQLVRTHNFGMVPVLEHLSHNSFNIVKVLLGLERVIDAVIPLLVKLGVRHVGVVAEMGASVASTNPWAISAPVETMALTMPRSINSAMIRPCFATV